MKEGSCIENELQRCEQQVLQLKQQKNLAKVVHNSSVWYLIIIFRLNFCLNSITIITYFSFLYDKKSCWGSAKVVLFLRILVKQG